MPAQVRFGPVDPLAVIPVCQKQSFNGKDRDIDAIGLDGLDMAFEGVPIFSACGRKDIDSHIIVDPDGHRIVRGENVPFVFQFLRSLVGKFR